MMLLVLAHSTSYSNVLNGHPNSPFSLEVHTRTSFVPSTANILPGVLYACKPASSTLKMGYYLSESWFPSHIFPNMWHLTSSQ